MSLRWEINNKVQALKGWIRRLLGRATATRRRPSAGTTDRVVVDLRQSGGKVKDPSVD
ncbi:hypothetical protein [Nonomuraea sp. NPDC002799]